MIDGCSRLGALFRVLVPVMKPGIAAAFIFNFVNCWNELFLSVTLMNKDVSEVNVAGTLAIVEIEALKSGKPQIEFDRDVVNFLGSDGKNLLLKFEK